MAIVDDAKLEQLAARRPKDLVPILERSASMLPLLVIFCFLPGILAWESASISELDAQWRLKALELSTASSMFDAVDPSIISTQTALRWQPPLGSWIAAASVHLPWPVGSHGLELTNYLFAASLVAGNFLLCARLMGTRIGLIAAALTAFHSTFLEQHQHAAPYGLAVAMALGAFWGFIGHLWRADELVSIDLLIGGISLGLCLLAGGPLAFVVIIVLLLLIVGPIEPLHDGRRATSLRSRRIGSRWQAMRSLGVLIATAFAAGGWWQLMMLYSYGGDFWSAWLSGMAVPLSSQTQPVNPASSGDFAVRLIREIFTTTRALSGFTILGLWIVARGLFPSGNRAGRTNFRFCLVWVICGLAAFGIALRDPASESLYTNMWRLFLMCACVSVSAIAVDEIARQRISLTLFVGVTLATLLCGYAFLQDDGLNGSPSIQMLSLGLIMAAGAVLFLRRFCDQSDVRQWVVFVGLIAAAIIADVSIGISAIRTDNSESRSLMAFRRSLPEGIDAEACMLISENEAPYRLQFVLKAAWPSAQLVLVRDWDEALKTAVGEGETPKTAVVVDWSQGNSRPANPTGAQWAAEPVGNPQFFEHRQLRAYILVWERKAGSEDSRTADANSDNPAANADQLAIGRFRRNFTPTAGVDGPLPKKFENARFRVDAFGQKAYRPARNSTAPDLQHQKPD